MNRALLLLFSCFSICFSFSPGFADDPANIEIPSTDDAIEGIDMQGQIEGGPEGNTYYRVEIWKNIPDARKSQTPGTSGNNLPGRNGLDGNKGNSSQSNQAKVPWRDYYDWRDDSDIGPFYSNSHRPTDAERREFIERHFVHRQAQQFTKEVYNNWVQSNKSLNAALDDFESIVKDIDKVLPLQTTIPGYSSFEARLLESVSKQLSTGSVEFLQSDGVLQRGENSHYEFKSIEGDLKQRLVVLHAKLTDAVPQGPQGREAKKIGLAATEESDIANSQGEIESAEGLYEVGLVMLDITLGFIPPTALAGDMYAASTGKNLITGDVLSSEERALAVFGAVTFGFGGSIARGLKAFTKLSQVSKLTQNMNKAVRITAHLVRKAAQSGVIKLNALKYMVRVANSGQNYTFSELIRIGQMHEHYSKLMSNIPGVSWSGKITRAVEEVVKDSNGRILNPIPGSNGLSIATNTDATVFKWHAGLKYANNRFAVGGKYGEKAMSAALGENVNAARMLALEEMGARADLPLRVSTRTLALKNVLDLTDAATVNRLGISSASVAVPKRVSKDSYIVAQTLGSVARENNFEAIISRSAINPNQSVIHIFNKTLVGEN